MFFDFWTEKVPWERVKWYLNLSGTWRPFLKGHSILIMLKYEKSCFHRTGSRPVFFYLQSLDWPTGWSPRSFTTVLDKYIPEKRREKIKAAKLSRDN